MLAQIQITFSVCGIDHSFVEICESFNTPSEITVVFSEFLKFIVSLEGSMNTIKLKVQLFGSIRIYVWAFVQSEEKL